MLVLSRKLKQAIHVGPGGEIRISIESIQGNEVRLGIVAPREVPVHREEIQRRIAAQEAAAKTSTER